MRAENDQPLPVVRVGEISKVDHAQRWLVNQLWGDSSVGVIDLRRTNQHLLLTSEHRAAPAAPPVYLQMVASDTETHLEVIAKIPDQQRTLQEQVLDLLGPGVVLTRAKLRDALGVKNERLGEALESLERAGRLRHTPAGWQRCN